MSDSEDEELADKFLPPRREGWLKRLLPLGIIFVVLSGAVLLRAGSHKRHKFGEACETASDCAENQAICLVAAEASTCTRACGENSACPTGYDCKLSTRIDKSGQRANAWMSTCVKPRATTPTICVRWSAS